MFPGVADDADPKVLISFDDLGVSKAWFVTPNNTILPALIRDDGVVTGDGAVLAQLTEDDSDPTSTNTFQGLDVVIVADVNGIQQTLRLVQPKFLRTD